MKDAQALEHMHREASERRRDADSAAAELADSSRARKTCADEYSRARAHLEQRQLRLAAATDAAAKAALDAGLEDSHHESLAALDIDAAGESGLKQVREKVEREILRQIEKLDHARSLN